MLRKARILRDLAERLDLHGLYFQHIALCRRRAWLHLAGATHAVRSVRVRRGLALHQTEKRPDHVPQGLGIAPDAIDFDKRLIIERKGGAGARDAVSRQASFYAAYMTAATGEVWEAEIHVYGTRKPRSLPLTEDMLDQLTRDAEEAPELLDGPAPAPKRISLCDTCSCNPLCWDED